jgi:hypothetical protein
VYARQDALFGVKTTEEGTTVAAAVPSASSFVNSNDCGGQFYSNEEQFPFLLLICNQML